jgi:D-alanyl-D-alanine carboxypeptidase
MQSALDSSNVEDASAVSAAIDSAADPLPSQSEDDDSASVSAVDADISTAKSTEPTGGLPDSPGDSGSSALSGDEQPVPVESPGGGRITDKSEPAPGDLVTIAGYGGIKVLLHRLAALFWSRLIDAARIDGIADPYLLPLSGYRSVARQQQLWQAALEKYGSPEQARMYVAPPGSSAHQSGRAVDCWLGSSPDSQNVLKQQQTTAYVWLVDNAERFGFYPYEKEPWHWEYNPPQI